MAAPTLLTPYGYSSSTCGYCSTSGERSERSTSKKYGLEAPQMSVQFYQYLIDRGWRRSGDYVYHPDMARTCCPQYTIRLDAGEFKPNKKQRQAMNRWNRFVGEGVKPGEDGGGVPTACGSGAEGMQGKGKAKGKGKGKSRAGEIGFLETLLQYEAGYGQEGKHRSETVLTPAVATKETFELYKRYQVAVHKDKPEKVTMRGFQRFLCDGPLLSKELSIKYDEGADTSRLPKTYGSYHLLYKVDGHLVGISVIDILPSCVSSVYFIWDPDWAWASLGKLSALREVGLVREMARKGAKGMGWLYMGYWIPDCQKMRYKSEYSPSYLLDPGTNVFHPLSHELDKFLQDHPSRYHPFCTVLTAPSAQPRSTKPKEGEESQEDSDMEELESLDAFPIPPPPGFDDPSTFSDKEVNKLLVLMQGRGLLSRAPRLVAVEDLEFVNPQAVKVRIREMVAAVGMGMMASSDSKVRGWGDKGVLFFG